MRDILGKFLLHWRVKTVLPFIHGHLLDLGCGTNRVVRSYSGRGIGVDIYQWGDVDVILDDPTHLPFANEVFDTVTIVGALNHISERKKVLGEVYRVLRPCGRVVITMLPPQVSRVWHFLRQPWDADQMERGMKPGEVFGLTRKDVHHLLSTAQFDIVCERAFMLGPNRVTIAKKKPR